jgi:hypothetical protein
MQKFDFCLAKIPPVRKAQTIHEKIFLKVEIFQLGFQRLPNLIGFSLQFKGYNLTTLAITDLGALRERAISMPGSNKVVGLG